MTRAQESFSPFLTGLILCILLIIITISCTNQVFFQNKIDVRSRMAYDQLTTYIQSCLNYQQTDCYCPYVTLPSFPNEDIIHLVTAADGAYLDLTKQETGKLLLSKKINDKSWCYIFESLTVQRKALPLPNYYRIQAAEFMVSIFMVSITSDGRLCHDDRKSTVLSEFYTSSLRTCSQKKDYPQQQLLTTFLAHRYKPNSGDPKKILTIDKDFLLVLQRSFLPLSLVSTSSFGSALGLRDSSLSFDNIRLTDTLPAKLTTLSKNLKQPLADKLVIISPLVSYSSSTSQDEVVLYYLQDSAPSRVLAEQLAFSLSSLHGKFYFHNQQLQDTPENIIYKLDFKVRIEPLTIDQAIQQGLFLAQPSLEQTYSLLFQERSAIPAVFLDFVDNTNKFTLLDNHLPAFSEALSLGFQSYLEQLPKSSAPIDKPLDIFTTSTNP